MPEPFDAYQYLSHLRSRWRLPALMTGAAMVVALILSLVMTKQYTGRVTLVIEPPAGADARSATAVSPVWMESLRTYEHFASSDQLFGEAAEKFGLRQASGLPIESLKRKVLEVSIPRNTKVLEIAATLPDPRRAHELALFLAEKAVQLNRETNRGGDADLIADTKKRLESAEAKLTAAQSAQSRAERGGPSPEALRSEIEQLGSLQEEAQRLALSASLSVAEPSKARAAQLSSRAAELERQIESRQRRLAARTSEVAAVSAEYESAWGAREEVAKHLRDLEAASGFRSERLNLLDPGVVPEKPTSPNLPLNMIAAAGLALMASFFFVTLEFALQNAKAETMRKTLRVASKP
jgi:capsular polysaccharide biosynthesis protein